jgi:pimeloyl-ACP methyl ester carboxylesterase
MSTHVIDRLAPVGFLLDRRSKVFADGWGDERQLALFDEGLNASDPLPELDLEWGRKEEHIGFRVRRATFTSPVAAILEPDARVGTVEWIDPPQGSDRIVVLLPAWNDEGFDVRRRLAAMLAGRGVGSYVADIPFYGRRRVRPDSSPAVGSVAEFAAMGHGAVAEGRALVAAAGRIARAGVAGFSMGGNLAAYVSATMPRAVATAPLAASYGPAPVYLEGALRRAIDWKALGGERIARPRLQEFLGRASVLRLPALDHHPAAVIVCGGRDGFVPPDLSRQLAAHWRAELRTVDRAGHGTLLWRHKDVLVDAVHDAFGRVEST